jgi:hypothetical protein
VGGVTKVVVYRRVFMGTGAVTDYTHPVD